MSKSKWISLGITTFISLSLFLSGCSMSTPLKKPDIGPAGKPVETKANPPFTQRFMSPPQDLYNLEATAGVIFEGIVKNNWVQVEDGLSTVQQLWPHIKILIGDKKGVKEADEALGKLASAAAEKKNLDSYESLTAFMGSISEIGKSYKLSPLSDIISVGNAIRTVQFYVADHDWRKAAAKMKELDSIWGQAKPSMESLGIWSKVITAHSTVKQMKDAIDAENKSAIDEHIANINESMGYIREYYHNKE